MKPAYGRGELLAFRGDDGVDEQVEFVMFKNAASLQLNLDALPDAPEQVLLAIDEGRLVPTVTSVVFVTQTYEVAVGKPALAMLTEVES